MTVEEKKDIIRHYCGGRHCDGCALENSHITKGAVNCIIIGLASEEELDEALRLIKKEESDKGAAQVLTQIKELKSTATVIQLEVKDNSPMQIAYAIRNYIWEYYGKDYEIALIALDELTEHIDAYVRAERKALEYKKLAEEG